MFRSLTPLSTTSLSTTPLSIRSLATLFEISGTSESTHDRQLSTVAFDWLYVLLGLLGMIGFMMDVWSHDNFGPDQSIFNEYHLLMYSAQGATMVLLVSLVVTNLSQGYALANTLPHGYGRGFLAVLLWGASGVADLTGHAPFGFETAVEAIMSPTHLALLISGFLIHYAPVSAARTRAKITGQSASLLESFPKLLAYSFMLIIVHISMIIYFPMGSNPYMLQKLRPAFDYNGWVMGISGTLLQTAITVPFVLWLAREFRMPLGGYTVTFGIYGLFLTIINAWQMPWLMFGGLGILLDIAYWSLKPDATQRSRFILLTPAAMWFMTYSTLALVEGGLNAFYYSGYMLYGSIAQAIILGALVGYLMSMPGARPVAANSLEVSHA
ncbi:hypothetical protein KFU94_42330 [Chloroflexi bacterium TSY]|nr:hypothetical protein [Chloroflexi bacterium TSY]